MASAIYNMRTKQYRPTVVILVLDLDRSRFLLVQKWMSGHYQHLIAFVNPEYICFKRDKFNVDTMFY